MHLIRALLALGACACALAQQQSDAGTQRPPMSLPAADTSILPSGASLPTSLGTKVMATATSNSMAGKATMTAMKTKAQKEKESHSAHKTSSSSGGALPTAAGVNMAPVLGLAVAVLAV
ncbi:hypothetical protein CDD83_6411 [Cordyceps sp. RAO-2017]|nr:hypothetical protein CDD83_6411 [Cordyceps sp. RAO-2017]